KPAETAESSLRAWLADELLPSVPARPGLSAVHLLKGALVAASTAEQRIRGADTGVDWALIATGHDFDAVVALQERELDATSLQAHGASSVSSSLYEFAHSLTADEVGA